MKKLISGIFLISMILSFAFPASKLKFNVKKAVRDSGNIKMNDINAVDLVLDMKTGWNLGNTMDATGVKTVSSETSWGQPKTTKEMIDGVAAAGFKTIRIPVSWSDHFIDSNYTIDPEWMMRVKEIVDWAISDGMYVILNDHHDNFVSPNGLTAGNGYYPDEKNFGVSAEFFANIWAQIGLAFNNGYDEHLIFETMNEPRLRGTDVEWNFKADDNRCRTAVDYINKLNQLCVDTIRSTSGNNTKRHIMVPGYVAAPASVLDDSFILPTDRRQDKLIISVHMYSPYNFAGQSPGTKNYIPKMQSEIATTFKKLGEKFVKNGVGVVIGEYGAVNKNNLDQRIMWAHAFIKYSRFQGITSVLWDNGNYYVPEGSSDYSEKYGYYNRKDQTWYFPEFIAAIMSEF